MIEKNVEIQLETGLQARPAAFFVQEANRFHSDISIERDGKVANAKSIMGIMSLAVQNGTIVKIIINGSDEQEAMKVLLGYVKKE